MANYNRDWDRSRGSSSQPWSDDRYDQYRRDNYRNENARNEDYRNERMRDNYSSREMDGLHEDQGKQWGRNRGFGRDNQQDDDRFRGDNDSNYNRGMYGNDTGVTRGSGNYLAGPEGTRSGRNYSGPNYRGNSRYPGNDYGDFYNRRMDDRDWWDKTKDEVSSWFGDEDAARRRQMDDVRENHRGRGPKGYVRSDERIREDINDRLMDDPHVDASDIEVMVSNAEVTLTGTVNSRFEKRHAEDIAESISGVRNVENRLRVSNNYSGANYGNSGSGNYGNANNRDTGNNFGASGAAPVGAFDTTKPGE